MENWHLPVYSMLITWTKSYTWQESCAKNICGKKKNQSNSYIMCNSPIQLLGIHIGEYWKVLILH